MSHKPSQRIVIPARRNNEPPTPATQQQKRDADARRKVEYLNDLKKTKDEWQ